MDVLYFGNFINSGKKEEQAGGCERLRPRFLRISRFPFSSNSSSQNHCRENRGQSSRESP